MLTYAFRQLRANNYEQVAGEDFEEIYDLFAEILARGISCQLKQGLHKSYVGHQDSLTTLRGKLDITARCVILLPAAGSYNVSMMCLLKTICLIRF